MVINNLACRLVHFLRKKMLHIYIIHKIFVHNVVIILWCRWPISMIHIQYIPRNMHTVTALLCFVVVIHWLIFPYPSGLLHWHCGNLTIAPVPAKQPWWIWINAWCEFIMNDCITTTKQRTTKPCAYFLGYIVCAKRSFMSPLDLNSNLYLNKHLNTLALGQLFIICNKNIIKSLCYQWCTVLLRDNK